MLHRLRIKNIALIEDVEIEFCSGLNILSGETGAGKSIIVDSIAFLLGTKADKGSVRSGQTSALVQGVFELGANQAQILNENGFDFIEQGEPLIIMRTLNLNGKNECRVNGLQVSAAQLRRLTGCLVDLHGQHEHQSLLNPSNHIKILDSFIKENDFATLKEQCAGLWEQLLSVRKQIQALGGDESERARALDLLGYQINEIEKAQLKDDEEQELLLKRQRLINIERIAQSLSDTYNHLNSEGGTSAAMGAIGVAARYDEQCAELAERLKAAKIELDDISDCVSAIIEDLQFDEKTADEIERRLDVYREIKRKYGRDLQAVREYSSKISEDYERLANAAQAIERLAGEENQILRQLESVAGRISTARKQQARLFERAIVAELNELGMKGSEFCVSFSLGKLSASGIDEAEFYLSTNKGEPIKPLSKIISGGEMSRLSLAIKVIAGRAEQIGTLIFDEIDTGISGKVGQTIAAKLAQVSMAAQVLCVTHLPQMAAFADNQYLITKNVEQDKTKTHIHRLDHEGMISEIERLSGAIDGSSHAHLAAQEMKQKADIYKEALINKA